MRGTGKKLLSILLALVMTIGLIPMVTVPVEAAPLTNEHYETVTVTTEAELAARLEEDNANYKIKMGFSIKETGDTVTFTVKGNKIIDLQGNRIQNWIANEKKNHDTTMFIIGEGASLTVRDSAATQGGYITVGSADVLKAKGEFYDHPIGTLYDRINTPPQHDIFLVDGGTLIIDSGKYTTGNSEDFWVTWGKDASDDGAYCGNLHYQSSGSVVTLQNGGTLVANGGTLEGRGFTEYGFNGIGNPVAERNSTIETDGTGNEVYINGGKFWGMGGANIFSIAYGDTIGIRGGEYNLHHHKRLYVAEYDSGRNMYSCYYNYGKGEIGIPNFWLKDHYLQHRMNVDWDGTLWTGQRVYKENYHDFMMLDATLDGDVIKYLPASNVDPQRLNFNGEGLSAEAVWNINESAYVKCPTKTYYLKTDLVATHSILYRWTVARVDGSVIETVENHYDDTLDLKKEWVEKNGVIKITCEIDEAGPSGHWTYESQPITISYTELPLTEDDLPGGGIELDVEYGKTTNTDAYYTIVTVQPDEALIKEALWCIDKVEYSLDYTNIAGQNATAEINHGSYFIIETEAGDTEATLTMTLTDIYGNKSTFTESVWLLRLPEIEVTANSHRMSADGSRHLITAGDTTAKLAFDTDNMDSDRFIGWYRTNEGLVCEAVEFTPAKSGVYTYRYYSEDGKMIVSEPVTVDFTDYSTTTNQTEDVIYFYAPEGSNQPTDSTLTIELSTDFNEVSNPTVEWVLKSYPAGGKYGIKTETLTPFYNYMSSGYAVDFSDFLDDSHGYVMPGEYVVQPVITFDTQDNTDLTAYGDTVTVTVRKYVDEIKLTANGAVIENGGTVTLAPGESLEFSYAIGNYSEYDTVYPYWDITGVDEGIVDAEDGTLVGGNYWGASTYESMKVTAKTPGQFTVSMNVYASKDGLDRYMFDKAVTCTVNVPVTDFEVTMAEPVENGQSGSDYFKTPEGALYTAKTIWLNEQQNAAKKFIPGIVSRANVQLEVAEGYVLPEKLSDINLKINGEEVSLEDVEYPAITSEDFRFVYNFGQLVFNKEVIEGQDIEFPIPAEGDAVDQYPNSANNTALFGETGGLKMFADWLDIVEADDGDDGDFTNDTASRVPGGAVYEAGKTYRLTISTSLYSSCVLGESFVPTVNGSNVEHDFNFGDTSFRAYYYFTPRALVDEITLELPAPAAMENPTELEMLNDGSSLIYPSDIQWFIDANGNRQLDENEGTAADFNADGSFKANTAYSMMVIMNLYDEDYDGVGDEAAFADSITVKHDDESGSAASVINCVVAAPDDDETVRIICHTFAPTGSVGHALVANPSVLTFNVVEGYTSVKPQTFTVESLGTETIPADQLKVSEEMTGFEVTQDGYTFTVQPLVDQMPTVPGTYEEYSVEVYYDDETTGDRIWANVAVKFVVEEAYVELAVEPESLDFYGVEGYESIDSQSFQIKNVGNYDGFYINPYTVTVRNESTEFDVKHEGDTVTVTPVAGLKEDTYEATLLVMANNYNGVSVTVPVTFYVDPQPEYGLEMTPEMYELTAYTGYGADTCAEFVIKSTGKNELTKEDLTVEIQGGNRPEDTTFDRYELTETDDGNMLLKVYAKSGLQPQLDGENNWPYYSGVSVAALKTVGEGEEAYQEWLAGDYSEIQFTVEYASYGINTRPARLEFSANKGYTNISETITAYSNGTGEITAIKAGVYEATGGLSENFTATVSGMNVTVTPKAGLAPGTYTVTVEIRDVENRASTTVPVTFTVTDYSITVSPESFSFTGLEGDDFYFTADFVAAASNGTEAVAFTAELEGFEGKVWDTGFALSAPENVTNPSISAGTYTGNLVLSIPGTDVVKKVPITVTIRGADYRLSVNPASLSFSLMEDYTAASESKTFAVTSTGADAVTDITVELPAAAPEPPVSISVADGANGSKVVTVTPKAGLSKGTYTASITVASESGKVTAITVPVSITVDAYTYGLKADVAELAFAAVAEGYENVPAKTVVLQSTGTGAITSLVVNLKENGTIGSKNFTCTVNGMTVTVAPAAGLKEGTYQADLMISDAAGKTSISIPVSFEVVCGHSVYGDWNWASETEHVRYCEQCGEPETKTHSWKVFMLREPEIGIHGIGYSVCTDCNYQTDYHEIPALETCIHACMNCGGCLGEDCWNTAKCVCGEPGKGREHTKVEAVVLGGESGLEVVALELGDATTAEEELNPYEKYVVDHMYGYMVESIYDISLRMNGHVYDLPDGETVTVRLFVGKDAAERIDRGALYLVHITNEGRVIYGTQSGQTPLTVEKSGSAYTGYISFVTDGFSPFVLASDPGEVELDLEAKASAAGCEVTLTSNASLSAALYLAAYDGNGKMLGTMLVPNFTVGTVLSNTFEMEFEGTAARVKAFLMQDVIFSPSFAALEDTI